LRVKTYLQPARSDFGANTTAEELISERMEAEKEFPFSNNSGEILHSKRAESVHIVVFKDDSIATFIADENPFRKGPGKATLGRSSRHVTTVMEADVLDPSADTVSTKICVPGSMTPPGMEIRGFDVAIIADAIRGAAKQGTGEHVQAYRMSATKPLEVPDNVPSTSKGICCECSK
jgi:hypothetical protein